VNAREPVGASARWSRAALRGARPRLARTVATKTDRPRVWGRAPLPQSPPHAARIPYGHRGLEAALQREQAPLEPRQVDAFRVRWEYSGRHIQRETGNLVETRGPRTAGTSQRAAVCGSIGLGVIRRQTLVLAAAPAVIVGCETRKPGPVTVEGAPLASKRGVKVAGKLSGDVRGSDYPDGRPESRISFLGDEPHGLARGWWPNGQLQWEVEYDRGKRHGQFRAWYDTGLLESERTYRNGASHGEFVDYHPNGAVAARGRYENGTLVECEGWAADGSPDPSQCE
jgi:hypothetical protein